MQLFRVVLKNICIFILIFKKCEISCRFYKDYESFRDVVVQILVSPVSFKGSPVGH